MQSMRDMHSLNARCSADQRPSAYLQEQQTPAEAASAPQEQMPAAGASWGSTGPSQGKRMTSRFFQPAAKRARSSSEGPEGAGQPQRRSASLPSNAEAQEVRG